MKMNDTGGSLATNWITWN